MSANKHYKLTISFLEVTCEFKYDSLSELNQILCENFYTKNYFPLRNEKDKVYVLILTNTRGKYPVNDEIFVSENIDRIIGIIPHYEDDTKMWDHSDTLRYNNIFLFEVESFEEAYQIALSFREVRPNCYKK